MKILLAVIMSTVITGTAFGACSEANVKECTTKEDCEGLPGKKYSFDASSKTVKCMMKTSETATNCLQANDKTIAKGTETGGAAGTETKTKAQ